MNKVVNHPIIKDKLGRIRDKNTQSHFFRKLMSEIVPFLLYDATDDIELSFYTIETPIVKTKQQHLKNDVVAVPILRAGLGMLDGVMLVLPDIRVGHIGLYRDETTFQPIQYYFKLPEIGSNTVVLILDPMLATGNSAIYAIDAVKKHKPFKIKFVSLIASPIGLKKINDVHPDVDIYLAAIDEKLNEANYIVPGLGDAGDRLYKTR